MTDRDTGPATDRAGVRSSGMPKRTSKLDTVHPAAFLASCVMLVGAVLGLASWGGWPGAAGIGLLVVTALTWVIRADDSQTAPRERASTTRPPDHRHPGTDLEFDRTGHRRRDEQDGTDNQQSEKVLDDGTDNDQQQPERDTK